MRKLVLHIDRLVLRNVTARESTAIASATKSELRRLLARPRTASDASAAGPGLRRDMPNGHAQPGKVAARIGTQIARAIRREVRR